LVHEFVSYKDSGNLLTVKNSHAMVEGKKIILDGPAYVRHCSSPTFWGKVKLAFGSEKSFNSYVFEE